MKSIALSLVFLTNIAAFAAEAPLRKFVFMGNGPCIEVTDQAHPKPAREVDCRAVPPESRSAVEMAAILKTSGSNLCTTQDTINSIKLVTINSASDSTYSVNFISPGCGVPEVCFKTEVVTTITSDVKIAQVKFGEKQRRDCSKN